jgi:hypothetical protein
MKNYIKLLKAFLFLLLVLIFGFFLFRKIDVNKTNNNTVQIQTSEIAIDASKFIGKTALEATKAGVKEIKTEGTGVNTFVTSINGRMADAKKNEFWELTINGKPAEVGAGSYIIKSGDKIVWKINTF